MRDASNGNTASSDDLMERPLHDVLGIPPLRFASEDLAPPVDERRLTALVRRELPAWAREETCRLIITFKSWFDAWSEALRREAASSPDPQC